MNPTSQPQTELPLFEVSRESENLQWLERYLKECAGWVTASALAALVERDDRWLRALAGQSDWVISGQKGYKHLQHATAEEVHHFVSWMESQAGRMVARAERLRRNAHRQVG